MQDKDIQPGASRDTEKLSQMSEVPCQAVSMFPVCFSSRKMLWTCPHFADGNIRESKDESSNPVRLILEALISSSLAILYMI